MGISKNTNNQLVDKEKEELQRQKKEYKLALEALFTDEADTASLKIWVIIAGCASIVSALVNIIQWIK